MPKMMNLHSYDFLPARQVGLVRGAYARYEVEEGKVYLADQENRQAVDVPTRAHAILLLSLLGRFAYGGSLEDVVNLYRELEPQVEEDHGLVYRGVRLDIFFHPSGNFEVEVEPGMGTTVCRMCVGSGDAAYEVVLGMIFLLRDEPMEGKPYLTRA